MGVPPPTVSTLLGDQWYIQNFACSEGIVKKNKRLGWAGGNAGQGANIYGEIFIKLNPFQTNNMSFFYTSFQTWPPKSIPIFRPNG